MRLRARHTLLVAHGREVIFILGEDMLDRARLWLLVHLHFLHLGRLLDLRHDVGVSSITRRRNSQAALGTYHTVVQSGKVRSDRPARSWYDLRNISLPRPCLTVLIAADKGWLALLKSRGIMQLRAA